MKKLLFLFLAASLLGCSGSDENNIVNQPETNNFFKVNNNTYPVYNAYIAKSSLLETTVFSITLTKGEVSFNGNNTIYENDITHAATFIIHVNSVLNDLPQGTFNFNPNWGFTTYTISDNIVIQNGEVVSSNTVSNQNDLVNGNGRIIISKQGENYNFNFNLVTSLGLIQGQYTGLITKNY